MPRRIFLTKIIASLSDPVDAIVKEQNKLTKERNKLVEELNLRSLRISPFGDAVAFGWLRRLTEIDKKCGALWEELLVVLGG